MRYSVLAALAFSATIVLAQAPRPPAPPIVPKAEELAKLKAKTDELGALVRELAAKRGEDDLVTDVAVYEKAGRMLLEFPEHFGTQDGISHAIAVLDTGLERARQLQSGQSPWMTKRRRQHGYRSAVDGTIQPYGVSLPESYDGSKPTRLYVWMHGRSQRLTESDFLFTHPNQGPGRPPVADNGQIQLDLYGRWNGAGWHWAGEADVFEAMAAVQRRYKIDPDRIVLRGFSMGGEGAWHVALHHPDRFVAAEIGAGTWSRRAETPGLPPHQLAVLRIWENMHEWALNAFNLPVAGHDGDNDTQTPYLPRPDAATKHRGQLESSLKARDQLVKEGFKLEGDEYFYRVKDTPSIFLISKDTGHGTSPLVRQQLDAFLKEHADRGRRSPDRIRFLTYTARYNQSYWVTCEELEKHYERAEVNASRLDGGKRYEIATKNLTRLLLRETANAERIAIDGKELRVKPGPSIVLERAGGAWKQVKPGSRYGLHKVHGLQGPIDDAFLDPFLLVRPTGAPWNKAVNDQAMRTLARFDRLYASFLRGHPRVIDDKDLTSADFGKYNVVLFGDPGSNRWIAKLNGKLPVQWSREAVTLAGQRFSSADHFPALVYPNPLAPAKYVVINSGLTIDDREYNGDYGMPRLGDYAVLKAKAGQDVGEPVLAGLFGEDWRVRK